MRVAAILTAAGSGSRLGHALPKALVPAGDDALVVHAARNLAASGVVDEIVVTVPRTHLAAFASAMTHADLHGVPVRLAVGAGTRQASVAAGLAELGPDVDVVLVHDAARAFAPPALVRRVADAVREGHRAVVPGVPLADTVVQVDEDGDVHGVDRATLRVVQTPQGFDRALLDRAHARAAARAQDDATAATDDASLCARLGEPVTLVEGADAAVKITTPRDLALAQVLAAEASAAAQVAPAPADGAPPTDGAAPTDEATPAVDRAVAR
ncbi:2-C-methyl-D-erythritol 4-phosphate cytidylyltransferase [Cellulomonas sp. APG4]|uniref:2-C-methyl-D-erythritol 4-phosphate cytidylyltransferase n=1 Tax=Cellulomonas sp. APG4 TaxID=1538656 RepID=UPI001379642B|nr:2-C-methyl-D-erythritol 4-phosphate cytidylyltransferase [Cellulomonas sp. APG4]